MTLILPNDDQNVEEWNPHNWEVYLADGEVNLRIVSTHPRSRGRTINLRYNVEQSTSMAIALLRASSSLPEMLRAD